MRPGRRRGCRWRARLRVRPSVGRCNPHRKGPQMFKRTAVLSLIAIFALALPAAASAAGSGGGAVVFSRVVTTPAPEKTGESTTGETKPGETKAPTVEGGLFAARKGRLNQLTENP